MNNKKILNNIMLNATKSNVKNNDFYSIYSFE